MSHSERRGQLLDVTAEMIVESGFSAVTIQSVARRAGISRPIIYEHFGDLPGLLTALVERETTEALAQVSASTLTEVTAAADPTELILDSLRTYLTAVVDHPTTWRLVLMPPEGAPEILRRTSFAAGPGSWSASPMRSRPASAGRPDARPRGDGADPVGDRRRIRPPDPDRSGPLPDRPPGRARPLVFGSAARLILPDW